MELVIKIKDATDFNIFYPLFKRLGISFTEKTKNTKSKNKLPITYAKEPDFMTLAGIWENKNVTAEQLRKEAWGDRI